MVENASGKIFATKPGGDRKKNGFEQYLILKIHIKKEEKIINNKKIKFFKFTIQEYFCRFIFSILTGNLNAKKQKQIKADNKNIREDSLILTLNTPINSDKNKKLNYKKLSFVINDKYIT